MFDGFISYSHTADRDVGAWLQREVQRFAKPWWRRRALRLFRDETVLAADPHLWSSVVEAMKDSEWLVLLASPEAASSPWVGRELAWWIEHKSRDRVLLVLTGGDLIWEDELGALNAERSTAVPPILAETCVAEPRWIDARWIRAEHHRDQNDPRVRALLADVASPLRGVAKDELESEELRQHRRTMRTAWMAVATLAVFAAAASVAGFVAVGQRNEARDQRSAANREAQRAEDAAASEQIERLMAESRLQQRDRIDLSILLALEALRRDPDADTERALFESITSGGSLSAIRVLAAEPTRPAPSTVSTEGVLWRATADGLIQIDMASGEAIGDPLRPRPGSLPIQAEAVGNGQLAVTYDDGLIQIVDVDTATVAHERRIAEKPVFVLASADERTLAVNPQGGGIHFLAIPDLSTVRQVAAVISGSWVAASDGIVAGGGQIGTRLQKLSPEGEVWVEDLEAPVTALAADAKSDMMAGALTDGRVITWSGDDVASALTLIEFERPRFGTLLAFGADGDLFVGRDDGSIVKLDLGRVNEAAQPFASISEPARGLWVDRESETVSLTSTDRWYRFRLDGLGPLALQIHDGERADAILATGDELLVGAQPGRIDTRAVADGALIRSEQVAENGAVVALARLPDAVAASVAEFSVDQAVLRGLQQATGVSLRAGLILPAVSALQESSIVLIEDSGGERWRLPVDLPVIGLASMDDGRWIVSFDTGGNLSVIDPRTGSIQQSISRANPFFGSFLTVGESELFAVGGEVSVRVLFEDGNLEVAQEPPFLGWVVAAASDEVVVSNRSEVRRLDKVTRDVLAAIATPTLALAEVLGYREALLVRAQRLVTLVDHDLEQASAVAAYDPPTIDIEPLAEGGFVILDGRGRVERWTMDPTEWRRIACDLVGRSLTDDEWERYFPEEDYRATCE